MTRVPDKIGNTDSMTITCLHQYFTFVAWGGEVKMSPPHPDVTGQAHAATFGVTYEFGDIRPAQDVREALMLMARITWDVGIGSPVYVEKLPVEDDEDVRFTVTLKKRQFEYSNTKGANV